MIDRTISHYKVTGKLGEGGMGVVYKAEDTNLKRPVALKFLAAHLLGDKEIKARFRREAEAAAALNHPNVCHVYEISEIEGKTFIAMAFLEGEPLEKKIEAGPLKLKDALDIAIQTARGLEAAHEKKIVHRDIKPANLMITGAGSKRLVTIMDFGLALLADRSKLTRLDETMGTVTYMSPEQTYGMELDHRTDVWSLGVVIYEMVTGQRPFKGHYDKAVMYSITNEEPEPMTALRTGVPMELELLVNKCLAKEADRRYQSTADMVVDLETLSEKLKSGKSTILRTQVAAAPSGVGAQRAAPSSAGTPQPGPAAHPLIKYRVIENLASEGDSVVYRAEDTQLKRSVTINVLPESAARQAERRQRLRKTAFAVGGALAMAVVLLAVQWLRGPTPAQPETLRRFAFTPPVAAGSQRYSTSVAISPNGKHIAYTSADGEGKLWVRDLDQQQPRVIEGTEGAISPFWSPSSDFIGFVAAGELRKVSPQGGLASRLCQLPGSHFHGGSWSPDGQSIVFSSGEPHSLYEVPARGGAPNVLVSAEEAEPPLQEPLARITWPHFLPPEAGAGVLVFAFGTPSETSMMIQDLKTGHRELLGPGAFPFYSPSGHIVYQSAPEIYDLWALPFSLETLKASGEAFPISENKRYPTVAADQTLVYLDGTGSAGRQQLVWLDRRGEKTGEIGQAQDAIDSPALSPDGRLVAVTATEGSNRDVWVYDIARGVRTRLTSAPERDFRPVWSPAGDEVAFTSTRAGNDDIFLRQADGSGEEQVLAATPRRELLSDWSRDGKYLLYHLNDLETGNDLWYLERNEDGSGWEPHPFLQSPFAEVMPRFSPDGRYVAYLSNESGQMEVYVQPFPEGGRKVTVSSSGGRKVRWSRDGKELFYVEGGTLVAVSVSSGSSFSVGSATRLFEHAGLRPGANYPSYDVSADGQRFILAEPVGEAAEAPEPSIRVVMNWYEEFRDREGGVR